MSDVSRRLRPWRPVATRPLVFVCPYLALQADHRTALEVPDGDHACHAVTPVAALTIAEQAGLCLTVDHLGCPRYEARAAAQPDSATPAHGFGATRLVVTPQPGDAGGARARARPVVVAASVLLLTVAGLGAWRAIAGVGGGGTLPQTDGEPTPLLVAATASAAPRPSLQLTPPPSAVVAPAATAPTAAAVATPPAVPLTLGTAQPSTPEPRRYVVQPGDTLFEIASSYGSSVEEIMVFNALDSEFIVIDQVLLIP